MAPACCCARPCRSWSARWGEPDGASALRLAAQKLADQLSEVEELEARLERLLDTGSGP